MEMLRLNWDRKHTHLNTASLCPHFPNTHIGHCLKREHLGLGKISLTVNAGLYLQISLPKE